MTSTTLFGLFPYLALAVFAVGLGARTWRARQDPDALRAQAAEARALLSGGRLWRSSLLVLTAAHLLALLAPRAITGWNAAPTRLYLLEGAGLVVGVVALAGWLRRVARQLPRARGSLASEIADCMFLSCTTVALLSGVLTAAVYRWGSSWGVATLTPYLRSVIAGEPQTAYADAMPFWVRLHVTAAFVALALLPFCRLTPLLMLGIQRAGQAAGARAAGVTRRAQSWVRPRLRGDWIWPEEDARDLPLAGADLPEESGELPAAAYQSKL